MSNAARENSVTHRTLEIRLLGPFHIAVDGRAIPEHRFTGRKPQLLIKLLALQTHHQLHREQAMALLWPKLEPRSASNNLHKAIHLARRALEPDLRAAADSHFILTQGQQVILQASENLGIDVEAGDHLVHVAKVTNKDLVLDTRFQLDFNKYGNEISDSVRDARQLEPKPPALQKEFAHSLMLRD